MIINETQKAWLKNKLRALRWRLAVPFLQALSSIAGCLSRRQLIALGRAVGRCYCLVSRQEFHRAKKNLALAFPELDDNARDRLALSCFLNLGIGLLETLAMHRWSREYMDSLVINPEILDKIAAISKRKPGAVLVTGHLGNWEMLAGLVTRRGGTIRALGRRMEEEDLNSFLTSLRGASGVEIIYTDQHPKAMLQALRNGISISILPDQDITEVDGVFIDFFKRPAYTPVAPARLAIAARVPLYVAVLLREGDRFRVHLEGPLAAERSHDAEARDNDVRRLTQAWNTALENVIRKYPAQWVWMHRRWRNTPERIERRRTTNILNRNQAGA
ncbi:MAG: lysophospholipid acyltransferase family protein [Planctomycetes bacterium]|nr:lysophospholipid acyltransferase family protein [Planctomycetota bacterium]